MLNDEQIKNLKDEICENIASVLRYRKKYCLESLNIDLIERQLILFKEFDKAIF